MAYAWDSQGNVTASVATRGDGGIDLAFMILPHECKGLTSVPESKIWSIKQ